MSCDVIVSQVMIADKPAEMDGSPLVDLESLYYTGLRGQSLRGRLYKQCPRPVIMNRTAWTLVTRRRCNSLANSLIDQHQSYSRSRLRFPLFLFVHLGSVASSIVVYSIAEIPKTVLVRASNRLPGFSTQLFTYQYRRVSYSMIGSIQTPKHRRTDRRIDMHRHRQTQTDNNLCCVLYQRQVPLGALGELTFATKSQRLYKEARLYPFCSYARMKSRLIFPSPSPPLPPIPIKRPCLTHCSLSLY
jgi:hypothetical protein